MIARPPAPTPSTTVQYLHHVAKRPLLEVGVAVAGLPLWWVLGIEQIVPPLMLFVAALKSLFATRRLTVTAPFYWSIAFMVVALASLVAIDEPMRYFTYARTYGTYVTTALLLAVVPSAARSMRDVRFLLACLLVAIGAAALLGLAGITGVWRPTFTPPIAALLPNAISSTDYVAEIVHRETGTLAWFTGLGQYFRVKGFYLFSTMFAAALAAALPVAVGFAMTAQRRRRPAAWLLVALLSINLLFTTGRVAIIAALGGLALQFFLNGTHLRRALVLAVVATAVATVALTTDLGRVADDVLYARGEGSVTNRTLVYVATMEGWSQRPVFGWGTERAVEGLRFSAGSHSHHLGILYKHGLVGFVVYAGLLLSLAWEYGVGLARARAVRDAVRVRALAVAIAVLSIVVVNGLTDAIDLDASTHLGIWTSLAAGLAVARQARTGLRRDRAG